MMKIDLNKTIIYIDMDHTLCDYDAGFTAHQALYSDIKYPQSQPGLYIGLDPIEGAIETFHWLHSCPSFEVFILTAPSIKNSHCYSEKRDWVEKYLGSEIVERLIISGFKGLNKGHFLIDDCTEGKGQEYFEGDLIQFGSDQFPNWRSVKSYFQTSSLEA